MNWRTINKRRAERFKRKVIEKGLNINLEETYNLDYTMIYFMLPRLKAFKKVINGCPYSLCFDNTGVDRGVDYGVKKWEEIVQTIIDGWELFIEKSPCGNDPDVDKVTKADELFFKYFHELWW